MNLELTPALVVALYGVVISLGFEWIPGLSTWYNGLANGYQKLIMLGLMLAIPFAILGLNCVGWFTSWIPVVSCDQSGVETAAVAFLLALGTNQLTYLVAPKRGDRSA
jgi:hypothetical protein